MTIEINGMAHVILTVSRLVTRPAGRTGLLRVDMARLEEGAPRHRVHAVVE
jgi:hypothetical protein